MTKELATAKGAQRAMQRRIDRLHSERPDVWASFFTKAGEADRIAKKDAAQC
jgi:adenosyl cobinamide kinase/adenosyl cobinamide phosphate guanylyltransferase